MTKPPKRKPVRLQEEHGPALEVEQAIERRIDQLFVEAVQRHLGRPLSEDDKDALLERTRWRQEDFVARNKEGEWAEKGWVLPKGLYDDLGAAGVLAEAELRQLVCELELRLPGWQHGYGPSLPADGPTDAPPGSEEKIAVMRRRYLKRQSLHHPKDKKTTGGILAAGLWSREAPRPG